MTTKEELEVRGYATERIPGVMEEPRKGYYRKRNGETAFLLATEEKLVWYTKHMGFEFLGFKFDPLAPPTAPSSGDNGDLICFCGFEAKSAFGLQAHKRKHERESRKENS